MNPASARLGDDPQADEHLRGELTTIFKSRTRRDWTDFFIATDIAGAPAFEGSDLLDDEHVKARAMVYEPPADEPAASAADRNAHQDQARTVRSPRPFRRPSGNTPTRCSRRSPAAMKLYLPGCGARE